MNIWILDHYATPYDVPGITRHFDFAREFIAKGYNPTIFASSFNHRTKREERLPKNAKHLKETIDNVPFVWIKTYPYQQNDWRRAINMLTFSLRLIYVCLRYKEHPHVILASSPHPFTTWAGYIIAKLRHSKFIFEIRDLWPQVLIEVGNCRKRNPFIKILSMIETFLLRRASIIVILHPNLTDYICRKGIDKAKITFIPNGVNPDLFSDSGDGLPEEIDGKITEWKSQGKLLISYTGNHATSYSLTTIIETARVLQNSGDRRCHFIFLGDGPEKSKLEERVLEYNLNNVTFLQSIPKKYIPLFLKRIDIGILTYRKVELFFKYGISSDKLWEYMMGGKPVMLTWQGSSSLDPVSNANCGISVPPEDPIEMSKAIQKLSNLSDAERLAIGNNGRIYVMRNNSTPSLADKMLLTIIDACSA